jgi:4'-phosphopantetheinyl transferase
MSVSEVHLWTASVDRSPSELTVLKRVLSAEERTRAGSYRFQLHRDRFAAGRALRRLILARYLGRAPETITFTLGPQGKPSIEGEPAGGLRFNDSGSDGLAVFALAWGREVGVDVERVRQNADADPIVDMFGAPQEREAYGRLPGADRALAFHRWWTAKEAWLKAVGSGLLAPLDSFTVSFSATQPLRLLEVKDKPDDAQRWMLQSLDLAPGFAASLVVEGQSVEIRRCRWTGS